jgi:hypothetical protein
MRIRFKACGNSRADTFRLSEEFLRRRAKDVVLIEPRYCQLCDDNATSMSGTSFVASTDTPR